MPGTLEILYDPEDKELFDKYKWHISSSGYAVHRRMTQNGKKETIRLHRLINKTPEGMDTDHINQNKLDNRRSNLRSVTRRQNMLNRSKVNVCYDKSRDKWIARICGDYIGRFNTKTEAVEAYKTKLKEYI